MKLTRRDLLKFGAVAGAGMAVGQAGRLVPGGVSTLDGLAGPEGLADAESRWIDSTCPLCPARCGARLRRVGGRVVGIRPDAADPASQGALCPKAFALVQELYHPRRVEGPIRCAGERDSGVWKHVSWEEGLAEVAQLLRSAGPRMAMILGSGEDLSSFLLRRLARSCDADVVRYPWVPVEPPLDALRLACGQPQALYDLEAARCVVSFGHDWLLNAQNPARAYRAYGRLRPATGESRSRLWFVGPRFSLTALKSDAWVPCRVGTEGYVAFGVAAALLERGGVDEGRAHLTLRGFDEIRSVLVRDFTPVKVAEVTGVRPERLLQMAGELVSLRPALALGSRGRLCDQWAVVILNALLGSIGTPGGLIPAPEVSVGRVAGYADEEVPDSAEALAEGLRTGGRSLEGVIVYGANPAFTSPQPERWAEALARVRRVVCITPHRDETAALADLILPPALLPEREEVSSRLTPDGVFLRRTAAAVEPPPGTMGPAEMALQVARLVGGAAARALPWASAAEAAAAILDGGSERRMPAAAASAAGQSISTSPGAGGLPVVDLRSALGPGGSLWSEFDYGPGDLHLMVFFVPAFSYGYGAHLPYLLTATAPIHRVWWHSCVEINPEEARHRGIRDGDRVVLESSVGRIAARAKLYEGVPPDAVAIAFGMGAGAGSGLERGAGVNPGELLTYHPEGPEGIALWGVEKVRVVREVLA